MKSLTSEKIITIETIVVVSLLSFLLYNDLTRRLDAGKARKIGTITYKRRVAQRKFRKHVTWEDVERNEAVYNSDSIRTDEQSDAVIELFDGTRIDLDENTMIQLSFLQNIIDINFHGGSITAARSGIKGKHTGIESLKIRSHDTVVSIDDSDIQLTKRGPRLNTDDKRKEKLSLNVIDGSARIKTPYGERTLTKNQHAYISPYKKKIDIEKRKLVLRDPSQNSFFIIDGKSTPVEFKWSEREAIKYSIIEISPINSFKEITTRRKTNQSSSITTIPVGKWYWRIKAVHNNETVETSETRKIIVIEDPPVKLLYPNNGDTFSYRIKPPIINCKWMHSSVATEYTVEITNNPEMRNISKIIETSSNNTSIDTLDNGTYYWRVKSSKGATVFSNPPVSSVFKFTIRKGLKTEPPELLSPTSNKRIYLQVVSKKPLLFSWEKNNEIRDYIFTLSRDKKFEDTLCEEKTRKNHITLEKDIQTGTYFWRVSGICFDNLVTDFSSTRKITVTDIKRLKLLSPNNDGIILPPEKRGEPINVRFTWQRIDINGKYLFQISKNKRFKPVQLKKLTENCSYLFRNIQSGKYYWMVKLYDRNKNEITHSKCYHLLVKDWLKKPVAITPHRGDVINMINKDSLRFKWDKTEEANCYEFMLYNKKRRKTPVLSLMLKKNTYTINKLEVLDLGGFYWTIQAFERDKNKNILRKSPLERSDFVITLGNSIKKPKLIMKKNKKPKLKSPTVHYLK